MKIRNNSKRAFTHKNLSLEPAQTKEVPDEIGYNWATSYPDDFIVISDNPEKTLSEIKKKLGLESNETIGSNEIELLREKLREEIRAEIKEEAKKNKKAELKEEQKG